MKFIEFEDLNEKAFPGILRGDVRKPKNIFHGNLNIKYKEIEPRNFKCEQKIHIFLSLDLKEPYILFKVS